MTVKTWVNAHFRKGEVQIELNMQQPTPPQFTFRLVYLRKKDAAKGVLSRRQCRPNTSIGTRYWDHSPCGVAMVEFEAENKVLIQRMAKAWLAGDTDLWATLRRQVELALQAKAETAYMVGA